MNSKKFDSETDVIPTFFQIVCRYKISLEEKLIFGVKCYLDCI